MRELFGELGYEGTSIDAILRRAGMARGALYHHFPTKEALFDAVLDAEVASIAKASAAAARAAGDPVESLRAGCGAWLRAAIDPVVQRITLIDAPAVVGWSAGGRSTRATRSAACARTSGTSRATATSPPIRST